MPRKQLIAIGLDGASFGFMKPLIAAGKLPTIQKLLDDGVNGELASTVPLNCAAAWTTFLTGKNPGHHGVFDFFEFTENEHHKTMIDFGSVKATPLWKILEQHDKTTLWVNIPITYPPQSLNGAMVSGALTPPGKPCAYPKALADELTRKNYIIDVSFQKHRNTKMLLRNIQKMTQDRYRLFTDLLKRYDWDFALVNFVGAERLQQVVWDHSEIIQEQYIEYDRLLGKLIKQLPSNVAIMLFSEHGYGDVEKKFFVNEWLSDLKLLSKKYSAGYPSIPEFANLQYQRWQTRSWAHCSAYTSEMNSSQKPGVFKKWLHRLNAHRWPGSFPKEHLTIKWNETYAYLISRFSYAININLKGREPNGIVEKGRQYDHLRSKIIYELKNLRDPHTFELIIDKVYRGEDFFEGPFAKNAPDIIFIPKNYAYSLEANKRISKHVISDSRDQCSRLSIPNPTGIFIASGPGFRQRASLTDLEICDLVPNILHYFDLPVPSDMDGTVRRQLFEQHADDVWPDLSNLASDSTVFSELSNLSPISLEDLDLWVMEN
ncbi:alkaline phosphatase family protein [bacterium]|nr:alkaline phosphatase family protein [bacterium]